MNLQKDHHDAQSDTAVKSKSLLTVSAARVWSFIVYGIPLLAVLSVVSSLTKENTDSRVIAEIADRFILNRESSIPTILSFILMMFAAQLSLMNYFHYKRRVKSLLNAYWIAVALLFLFLAYDELAQIHENLRSITFGGILADQSWVFVGIPIVVAVGVFMAPFLLAKPRELKVAFVVGGAIFITGAIGFEVLGGVFLASHDNETVYMLITVIEESLELAGLSYVNYALLKHAAQERITVQFS